MAVPLATCMMVMPVQVNYSPLTPARDTAPTVERSAAAPDRQRRDEDRSVWRKASPHDPPSRVAFWKKTVEPAGAAEASPLLGVPGMARAAALDPIEYVFPSEPLRRRLPPRAPPAGGDMA